MTEPTADICLLTPVPLEHLQSGVETSGGTDLVVFGTNSLTPLRRFDAQIGPDRSADVLFYASASGESGRPKATYRARFVAYRDAEEGQPVDEWKAYRPPSTRSDDPWKGFYAVKGLRRLTDPVEISALPRGADKGPFSDDFVPKGPLIIDTPFPLQEANWQPSVEDFRQALSAALEMTEEELQAAALGSSKPRSYFIRFKGRTFGLKTITHLIFRHKGLEWGGPNSKAPQSAVLARMLHPYFEILHITEETEKKRLERQRESWERWSRQGQGKFRADLIKLFGATCPISGCSTLEAVDAAHIQGVGEEGDDCLENGWLLRADLHRLFDAKLMSVNPENSTVHFAKTCRADYTDFEGRLVSFPERGPSAASFAEHWAAFVKGSQ